MTEPSLLQLSLKTHSTLEARDYETAALHAMLAQSLGEGQSSYPYFRHRILAARIDQGAILERCSAQEGWQTQRPDWCTLVARKAGAFAIIVATGGIPHCTMSFRLWAATPAIADSAAAELMGVARDCRVSTPLFSLQWRYLSTRGIGRVGTLEVVQEQLLDEAYPTLREGVDSFLQGYLDAPENILVLQGPPGTGKTRLTRALLAALSSRKGDGEEPPVVLYSGDRQILESDDLFAEFLAGDHEALVIEDADHLLAPRSDGNHCVHRFLNASDGLLQAQGRKIIFSTNLPNVGDLDEALVRPGRCFAHLCLRPLQPGEARALLARLCGPDEDLLAAAALEWERAPKRAYSVAEVYALHRRAQLPDRVLERA